MKLGRTQTCSVCRAVAAQVTATVPPVLALFFSKSTGLHCESVDLRTEKRRFDGVVRDGQTLTLFVAEKRVALKLLSSDTGG